MTSEAAIMPMAWKPISAIARVMVVICPPPTEL
jgi:hypothetical protein